jgi:hypothetical protein
MTSTFNDLSVDKQTADTGIRGKQNIKRQIADLIHFENDARYWTISELCKKSSVRTLVRPKEQ